MLKLYEGYALPSMERLVYTLEYCCPNCNSEKVAIDTSLPVPFFCDGSPSTGDELRTWYCLDCNHRAKGRMFVVKCIDKEE